MYTYQYLSLIYTAIDVDIYTDTHIYIYIGIYISIDRYRHRYIYAPGIGAAWCVAPKTASRGPQTRAPPSLPCAWGPSPSRRVLAPRWRLAAAASAQPPAPPVTTSRLACAHTHAQLRLTGTLGCPAKEVKRSTLTHQPTILWSSLLPAVHSTAVSNTPTQLQGWEYY